MSGTMKNLTILPLMYTWSSCDTRPSRPVTVMSLREMLRLSSAVHCAKWMHCQFGRSTGQDVAELTLGQFSSVELPGLQLNRDDVPEGLMQKFYRYAETRRSHFCRMWMVKDGEDAGWRVARKLGAPLSVPFSGSLRN